MSEKYQLRYESRKESYGRKKLLSRYKDTREVTVMKPPVRPPLSIIILFVQKVASVHTS